MLINQRPYIERLKDQLGADGILRLSGLMYRDGLTPTEARPWLEPPSLPWDEIEATLFWLARFIGYSKTLKTASMSHDFS